MKSIIQHCFILGFFHQLLRKTSGSRGFLNARFCSSGTCLLQLFHTGQAGYRLLVWAHLLEKPAFGFIWVYARAVCVLNARKLCFEQAVFLSIGLSACLLGDIDSSSACSVFLMVWGLWHSLNLNVLQHGVVMRNKIAINQELAAILTWSTDSWHAIMVVFVSFNWFISPHLLL